MKSKLGLPILLLAVYFVSLDGIRVYGKGLADYTRVTEQDPAKARAEYDSVVLKHVATSGWGLLWSMNKRTPVKIFKNNDSKNKWLSEFKKTFLRNLNLKSVPHTNYLKKDLAIKHLPMHVKNYIASFVKMNKDQEKRKGIKISGYIGGEGYNARIGNSTVQVVFFKLDDDVMDASLVRARIEMQTSVLKCAHQNISMFEILPKGENGNSRLAHDESKLLARYHIDYPMDDKKRFVEIGSLPMNYENISIPLTFDVTDHWSRWVHEFETAKEQKKDFYKGVILSCRGCNCGDHIIDTNHVVLDYTYTDKLTEEEIKYRQQRLKDLTTNNMNHTRPPGPDLVNECTKFNKYNACCVSRLLISIEDIHWDNWILYPRFLAPNICAGSCKYKVRKDTILPAFVDSHRLSPEIDGEPEYDANIKSCCYPSRKAPEYIYYIDEHGKFRIAEYDDFSVMECSCS